MIRNLGAQNLVLVGGTSSSCVDVTGRTAADLGFRVVLAEDGCCGYISLLRDATLIQSSYFLGRALSTQEVIQELQEYAKVPV